LKYSNNETNIVNKDLLNDVIYFYTTVSYVQGIPF